jgi:hypothetical protein
MLLYQLSRLCQMVSIKTGWSDSGEKWGVNYIYRRYLARLIPCTTSPRRESQTQAGPKHSPQGTRKAGILGLTKH